MTRGHKILLALFVDICLGVVAFWASLFLRLGGFPEIENSLLICSIGFSILSVWILYFCGFYKQILRASSALFITALKLPFIGLIISQIILNWFVGIDGVPRTLAIIYPLIFLCEVVMVRLAYLRLLTVFGSHETKTQSRALIYGAGAEGRAMARALGSDFDTEICGFIDPNPSLRGLSISGKSIYAPEVIGKIVLSKKISDIYLCVHALSRAEKYLLSSSISGYPVSVHKIPSFQEMILSREIRSQKVQFDTDFLLGRKSHISDGVLAQQSLKGKRILITGAGGSIGSELVRQIFLMGSECLILVDLSEASLYQICEELKTTEHKASTEIVAALGSIQDAQWINELFETYAPDVVFHAAAYKHVPIVEENTLSAVKNNVIGTLNLAMAASSSRVQKFLLISSDKAVRPTNIMGVTKRVGEHICHLCNSLGPTLFAVVRFGNVLGSSGSVVPKFQGQIDKGGPITITHPEIVRFFMSIEEAVSLVIQSLELSVGGDLFILDMGDPVKIEDLAKRLINLNGLDVDEIGIEYSGLRKGEKLYEELLISGTTTDTCIPKVLKASDMQLEMDAINEGLEDLIVSIGKGDVAGVYKSLLYLVPESNLEIDLSP